MMVVQWSVAELKLEINCGAAFVLFVLQHTPSHWQQAQAVASIVLSVLVFIMKQTRNLRRVFIGGRTPLHSGFKQKPQLEL